MELSKQIELEQKLAVYHGEDEVLKASEVLELYLKDHPRVNTYSSGLPTLDKVIGGLYPGQLIVISGITGSGKTTLAQTFTIALTKRIAHPLWFTYELPVDDFMVSFPGDWGDFFVMPGKLKDNKVNWIEERIIESKLKFQSRAVFIDHLHYLVSMNPKTNMSGIIGETVRRLKQIAIEHRVIVFLICHMMKTKPDEEPGLGHARDSSFIEQEADCVLYTFRFKDDKSITVCKVAKNRRRGIVDERIPLVLKDGRYYEKTD
jgi:replicative DNA helicase